MMAEPNQNAPQRNRRSSRRQPVRGSTRVRASRNALGLGSSIAQTILDLSEGGARVLLKEELPVGREFELVLDSGCTGGLKALATVIWCIPAADGAFCVGVRFSKPLPHRNLVALARP